MKYYLADFTQHDGEHEHIERLVLSSESEEAARKLCDAELYDCGGEPEGSMFGYGDGETAVSKYDLTQLSKDEFGVLRKYLSDISVQQELGA